MSTPRDAAAICYAAHALILIFVGVRYLSNSMEFQLHHRAVLRRDWNSLDPALAALTGLENVVKRIELLKELVPGLSRVAVLVSKGENGSGVGPNL